jgi:hypothetical protein
LCHISYFFSESLAGIARGVIQSDLTSQCWVDRFQCKTVPGSRLIVFCAFWLRIFIFLRLALRGSSIRGSVILQAAEVPFKILAKETNKILVDFANVRSGTSVFSVFSLSIAWSMPTTRCSFS